MMSIFFPVLRSVMKRKEAKIFLLFSLTPLLYFLSTFVKTKLFSFSGPPGAKIAFFDFFYGQFNLYLTSVLPSLALAFLVASVFQGEFSSGIMYLYKDMNRTKVFFLKVLSILTVVIFNSLIYFISCLFTYYTRVAYLDYGSLQFWSNDFRYSIASSISVVLILVLTVFLSSLTSLYFKAGIVIVVSLVFNILVSASRVVSQISSFLPSGYVDYSERNGLFRGVGIMLIIVTLYALLLSIIGIWKINKIEY